MRGRCTSTARPLGSHVLVTDALDERAEGTRCVELAPGDAVAWHGRTAHYSRGNTTGGARRAFIAVFRPKAMVEWERAEGFDHLRQGMEDYDAQAAKADAVFREGTTAPKAAARAARA